MRSIIIPDIHNDIEWAERVLAFEPHDEAIFLGDYFDNYDDTPDDAYRTARWLKKSLMGEKRKHLMGNHDMPYRFPKNPSIICPGYTKEKRAMVDQHLTRADWEKIGLLYISQGWWCSHAGIHPRMLHPVLGSQRVKEELIEAFERARAGLSSSWLAPGEARGGHAEKGGIVWLDWRHEFEPVNEMNQIVGHTNCDEPDAKAKYFRDDEQPISINWCIDCRQSYYAIIENGKLFFSRL